MRLQKLAYISFNNDLFYFSDYDLGSWEWKFNWPRSLHPLKELQYQQLLTLLPSVRLSTSKEDLKRWDHSSEWHYTVQSGSNIIDLLDFPGSFAFTTMLWKGIVPPKIEMFLWLVLQERVCTRSFLLLRNLIHPSRALCPPCQLETEHVQHLFLPCQWSSVFISKIQLVSKKKRTNYDFSARVYIQSHNVTPWLRIKHNLVGHSWSRTQVARRALKHSSSGSSCWSSNFYDNS